MPSLPARLLPPLMRLARFDAAFSDPATMRDHMADRMLRPQSYAPPVRLTRAGSPVEVTIDHVGGWPVYTVRPRRVGERTDRRVVYVHGGAWVNEISPWHWRFVARLASASGATFVVPIYPLAPSGTAGAVVAGVVELVREKVDEVGAERVSVMGDSAGGQISLSAAQVLRDDGVRLGDVVLVAPALDLSLSNPDIPVVEETDPWLARAGTRECIEAWRADLPLDDPRVSPLAGDLRGLGRLAVFVGTRDIVWPDCRLLADRARDAGIDVELHVGEGLVHVYPLLPIPEAREAVEQIVRRLR